MYVFSKVCNEVINLLLVRHNAKKFKDLLELPPIVILNIFCLQHKMHDGEAASVPPAKGTSRFRGAR